MDTTVQKSRQTCIPLISGLAHHALCACTADPPAITGATFVSIQPNEIGAYKCDNGKKLGNENVIIIKCIGDKWSPAVTETCGSKKKLQF